MLAVTPRFGGLDRLGSLLGWHGDGWLLTKWGWHDFGAAGCVHMVAGFFALGVLINLGPRIGKFNSDGTANDLARTTCRLRRSLGLMLIIVGFFGFLMAWLHHLQRVFRPVDFWATIYGTPTTLVRSLSFNIAHGISPAASSRLGCSRVIRSG